MLIVQVSTNTLVVGTEILILCVTMGNKFTGENLAALTLNVLTVSVSNGQPTPTFHSYSPVLPCDTYQSGESTIVTIKKRKQ